MQNSAAPMYEHGYPPPMMQAQMFGKGKSMPATLERVVDTVEDLDLDQ
jgi:hypothetical protein